MPRRSPGFDRGKSCRYSRLKPTSSSGQSMTPAGDRRSPTLSRCQPGEIRLLPQPAIPERAGDAADRASKRRRPAPGGRSRRRRARRSAGADPGNRPRSIGDRQPSGDRGIRRPGAVGGGTNRQPSAHPPVIDREPQGTMAGLMGGYERRQDDWTFQAEQADAELKQIDTQITAAKIRQDIAEKELGNHDPTGPNAKAVDAYLATKFSNTELYEWMSGPGLDGVLPDLSTGDGLARRAERAYRHELGPVPSEIHRRRLLEQPEQGPACRRAARYDLHRMEAAYIDNNRREFEITKHVSLALIDPLASSSSGKPASASSTSPRPSSTLTTPATTCADQVDGGHFPCITGPYAGVNCTLTMTRTASGWPRTQPWLPIPGQRGRSVRRPDRRLAVDRDKRRPRRFRPV